MKLCLLTFAVNLVVCLADPQPQSSSTSNDASQSENNIAFDLPDLAATIEIEGGGEFQIEAYKSVNNDRILMTNDEQRTSHQMSTSQLFWVSVGQPMFIKSPVPPPKGRPLNSTSLPATRLFHFTTDGFYTYVQMLTPAQRRLLAATANTKYRGVNVTEGQVVNLILSKFECSLVLYDEVGSKYLITGKVIDFRNFPLRVDFKAPRGSIEKKLFVDLIPDGDDESSDLQFVCEMASRGKLMRTNTLTITQHQIEQINIIDKLFGPTVPTSVTENGQPVVIQREAVFVTRNQLTELAGEMYSTLNIVEDYQMPELQFSEAFVDGLLTQVAISHFTVVPIEAALETLSSYRFEFNEDIQADKIRRDIGSILKIDQYGGKSRIILNESAYSELQQSSYGSGGGKASLFGLTASASWANDNSRRSVEELRSLNDQLRELNLLNQLDVKWAIEGERVIPKSLNVARLGRSRFSRTLTFRRVRLQTFNAAFDRQFGLYTRRIVQLPAASSVGSDRVTTQMSKLENDVGRINAELSRRFSELDEKINISLQPFMATIRQHESTYNTRIQQIEAAVGSVRGEVGTVAARPVGLRRCRICFHEGEGSSQCQGNRNTCSGWSDSPSWTDGFRDDTDNRAGGCNYHWKIECQF